ncbi:hypothetical protein GCK32_000954 [Trichostrongylus colubriformis]|uniref:G-protein coupled receptors family 1 profile domain-containing protein n=1 Tax=Trichostrongylus colubriformis TaxID=6319 RepID=A0AAN8FJM2_TRICO
MDLSWQQAVFMMATIVTLPLHFAILLVVGVADVVSLVNYIFINILPLSQLFNEFYFENRQFLANYGFRSVYFSVFLRNVGVALMSLQRYICVCKSGAKVGKIVSRASAVLLAVLQWGAGLFLVLPLCQLSYNVTYEMKPKLELSIPPPLSALANMMVLLSSAVLLVICMMCYAFILDYILRNSSHKTQSKRHEMSLCGQVAGLVFAFMVQFVFNGGTYILNSVDQMLLRSWRTLGPLVFLILSCVHPWTCIVFNKEIRDGVFDIFRLCIGRRKDVTTFTEAFKLTRSRTV